MELSLILMLFFFLFVDLHGQKFQGKNVFCFPERLTCFLLTEESPFMPIRLMDVKIHEVRRNF